MKFNIEVDVTPDELREALGLPDVKSAQNRMMAKLEAGLEEEIAKLSPEAIVQKWVGALSPNPDLMANMFQMMTGMAGKK